MQGVRFLLSNFAGTLQQDKTFEVDNWLEAASQTDFRNLMSYPPNWGTPCDNSPCSPFAFVSKSLKKGDGDAQKEIELLAEAGHCTMGRLFAATGRPASIGYQLFQQSHEVLRWPVPFRDFDLGMSNDSQTLEGSDAADAFAEVATEDTAQPPEGIDEAAAADGGVGSAPTPTHLDAEVPLPRGQLNVAGVVMLMQIVPWVVCHFRKLAALTDLRVPSAPSP